jgi:transposase
MLDFPSVSAIIIIVTSTTITFSNPAEEINHLKTHIQELEALIEGFQTRILNQEHQLEGLIKRLYGRSSEKIDPNQLLMHELILEADKNGEQKTAEAAGSIQKTAVAAHARNHHGRQTLPEHLKRVEHLLDAKDKDKPCDCGKKLVHIGDDVTERLDYQPSSLFVNRYVRPKYACGDCQCDGCGVIQHPTPEGPIERCEADAGLLAYIIVDKFEYHMPLFRQESRFKSHGVQVSRKAMGDWMAGSALALTPLYELMIEKILSYDIVGNDDTPVNMRDGPNKGIQTARMWATVGGENFKYTAYNFTTNRCKEGPLEFFKDYRGFFMSDAYAGYNGLGKSLTKEEVTAHIVTHLACWVHARRYFKDAQKTSPRAAGEVLVLIAKLYAVEDETKHLSPQDRFAVRLKESVPLLERIKKKLEEHLPGHLPQSPMRQAINYTLGLWKELNVFLQDGRLPIDNNLSEQAIRPIALGRKNWLFLGSENGGHTAAVLMSFVATCHKNKINTWKYLKDVLQRIQAHPASRLDELLPDKWQALQSKI